VAIEGPLKELNIHDIFQLLDLGRKTGVLRITSELRQNAGVVYFERGAVIAAQISTNPHPIGEILIRVGKLSPEELARARAAQDAGDRRRLGEILVALGAVSQRELDRCVRAQVEEVVFELVSWSEGYFSFVEGRDLSGVEASVSIPTEALLMEAARRIDEWARIESKVPHLGVVPRLKVPEEGTPSPLELVPFEWEVLAAIDGRRDVRAIADDLGRSEFDVARTMFGLTSTGVIVLDDRPQPSAAGDLPRGSPAVTARVEEQLAMGDLESARVAAEDVIAADPDRPEGYAALGRTLLAMGRPAEAAELLEQALHRDPLQAPSRRLLALAQAVQGRFAEALATWDRWERTRTRYPEEDARAEEVARLRQAVATLAQALRQRDA
jgi:hypothetical protein